VFARPWLLALGLIQGLQTQGLQAQALQPPSTEQDLVRVPGATIALGSTVDDVIAAANFCNRLSGRPACQAEDFARERRDEKAKVAAFLLDRTEVSLGAYLRCQRAGVCSPHEMPAALLDVREPNALPVTMVSLEQAETYCSFRGARLPSESEFELAARGQTGRMYPWGNLFHSGRVNGGRTPPEYTSVGDGYELLAPAYAFSAGRTPLGILQLSGNVAEWTSSPERDRAGEKTGMMIVRGGHFASPPWELRAAHRDGVLPAERRPTLGFRCARSYG